MWPRSTRPYTGPGQPSPFCYLILRPPENLFGGLALASTLAQALAPGRIRARLLAVEGLFYIGFGALSPLLVGALSDWLGGEPSNLLRAMLSVALPAFAVGALLLRLSERHLEAVLADAREG